MPKLLIKTGQKKGFEYRLTAESTSIGRSPSNDVVLPDSRVSRHHACVLLEGVNHFIQDLDSVNGTKVNGLPVTKQVLKLGDEISFGSTVLKYLSVDGVDIDDTDQQASGVTLIPGEDTSKRFTVEMSVNAEKVRPLTVQPDQADPRTLEKAYQRLSILYRISNDLGTVVELKSLLDKILELVLDVLNADRGFIMLIDTETQEFGLPAVCRRKGLEKEEIAISKTIINQVRNTGESLLISDTLEDERFKEAQSIIHYGIRSTMCVPVKSKEGILGVMHVDSKGKVIGFTKEDLELLSAICNQAAVAIENAKLFEDLRKANQELKERQNQLIEAEKLSALGQLAGGVAHELNNPMTSILGFSQLSSSRLEKDPASAEVIKECVEHIKIVEREAQRCQQIVQSLLQFARRKKDQMALTDINKVIDTSLTIAQFQIKKVRIEIKKDFATDLPQVSGDANHLQQVFLNLIINARDAMDQGGVLRIQTKKADDQFVEITFSDTGCGIPEDKLEEIFKPLYTSKEEGKGTGLGLSITQDIIERHRGTIAVKSVVGQGTTFTIKLPVS